MLAVNLRREHVGLPDRAWLF